MTGAAAEFAKWNKCNRKVLAGLTNRRAAEKALFLNSYAKEEHNMDTLKNGATGQQVRVLQILLTGLTVDGIFGAKTEAAVKTYQQAKNLTVDGIAGINTWTKLLMA